MTETLTDIEASAARGEVEHERLLCCVVLPAYNEARALAAVVARIPAWVTGIIVVDDASTDDTLAVAQSLTDPRVTVLRHDDNRGVFRRFVARSSMGRILSRTPGVGSA